MHLAFSIAATFWWFIVAAIVGKDKHNLETTLTFAFFCGDEERRSAEKWSKQEDKLVD